LPKKVITAKASCFFFRFWIFILFLQKNGGAGSSALRAQIHPIRAARYIGNIFALLLFTEFDTMVSKEMGAVGVHRLCIQALNE